MEDAQTSLLIIVANPSFKQRKEAAELQQYVRNQHVSVIRLWAL